MTSDEGNGIFVFCMPSPNATPTITGTPPTATVFPTITPTLTITQTYTISPTLTATMTYTKTVSQTCTYTQTTTFTISPTGTITPTPSMTCTETITPTPVIPFCLTLYKNSPNPCSYGTNIIYQLCDEADVNVKIYTISGEVVVKLSQHSQPGMNSIYWDTKNKSGKGVASGTYIYSLEAVEGREKQKQWGKMAVVK